MGLTCDPLMMAWKPDPHNLKRVMPHCHGHTTTNTTKQTRMHEYLLTVSAGVAMGTPALREAWRARYAASVEV